MERSHDVALVLVDAAEPRGVPGGVQLQLQPAGAGVRGQHHQGALPIGSITRLINAVVACRCLRPTRKSVLTIVNS
eukprot:886860-Pyramimonas_sp.AAC.2